MEIIPLELRPTSCPRWTPETPPTEMVNLFAHFSAEFQTRRLGRGYTDRPPMALFLPAGYYKKIRELYTSDWSVRFQPFLPAAIDGAAAVIELNAESMAVGFWLTRRRFPKTKRGGT